MATEVRRDSAQLLLRMEPAERDRIRAVIPHGSFNPVALRLIMDYVRALEARNTRPQLPVEEDPAA